MAQIEPHEGRVFRRGQNTQVVRKIFEDESEKIRQGWLSRRRAERRGSAARDEFREKADDWRARITYRLVKQLVRCGHGAVLDDMMSNVDRRHAGRHDIAGQWFKQALFLIFGWSPLAEPFMSRNHRSVLGSALEYAYRHNVPSKYVCGFIKQVGLKEAAKKLKHGYREPGFN